MKYINLILSIFMLSKLSFSLPVKAQSNCQATINSVVNELKAKGVKTVRVNSLQGIEKRQDNPTNRIDRLGLILSAYNENYTSSDRRSNAMIDNIMRSPVLMKSYADRIVSNCQDIASVSFNADQSDWLIEFAIQSDGKTRQRDCIDSDSSLTPNWNQMDCY